MFGLFKKKQVVSYEVNMDNVTPPILELANLIQQPEKWEDKHTIQIDSNAYISIWLYKDSKSVIMYSRDEIMEKFYPNRDEVYYLLPYEKLLGKYIRDRDRKKRQEKELKVRSIVGEGIKKVLEG